MAESSYLRRLKQTKRVSLHELIGVGRYQSDSDRMLDLFGPLTPQAQNKVEQVAIHLMAVRARTMTRGISMGKCEGMFGGAIASLRLIQLCPTFIEEASLSALRHVARHELSHVFLDEAKKPYDERIDIDPDDDRAEWKKARKSLERRNNHAERLYECMIDLCAIRLADNIEQGIGDLRAAVQYQISLEADGFDTLVNPAPKVRVRMAEMAIKHFKLA